MRDTSSNAGNPAFVGKFQNCMLGDDEVNFAVNGSPWLMNLVCMKTIR